MPLSENEMKQIESAAYEWANDEHESSFIHAIKLKRFGIAIATAQAEKYQNEVEELKEKLVEHNANSASVGAADVEKNWGKEKDTLLRDRAYWQLEAQAKYIDLASRNSDIEQWKAAHDNCAAHFDEQSRELRELREVADLVVKALDYWDRTFQNDDYLLFQSMPTKDSFWRPDDEIKRTSEALAAYRKIKPEIKP